MNTALATRSSKISASLLGRVSKKDGSPLVTLTVGSIDGEEYATMAFGSPAPYMLIADEQQVQVPTEDNLFMSITCVYFNSMEEYAGQYHKQLVKPPSSHIASAADSLASPYGEINCVIPIDDTYELEGMPAGINWQGPGWTSNAPGSHHYPRARGGRGIALFWLPSGRIAYGDDVSPEEPQPMEVQRLSE